MSENGNIYNSTIKNQHKRTYSVVLPSSRNIRQRRRGRQWRPVARWRIRQSDISLESSACSLWIWNSKREFRMTDWRNGGKFYRSVRHFDTPANIFKFRRESMSKRRMLKYLFPPSSPTWCDLMESITLVCVLALDTRTKRPFYQRPFGCDLTDCVSSYTRRREMCHVINLCFVWPSLDYLQTSGCGNKQHTKIEMLLWLV